VSLVLGFKEAWRELHGGLSACSRYAMGLAYIRERCNFNDSGPEEAPYGNQTPPSRGDICMELLESYHNMFAIMGGDDR